MLKKLLISSISLVILLGVSITVFADNNVTTVPTAAPSVQKATYDPIKQTIKANLVILEDLRNQDKQVCDGMKQQQDTNKSVRNDIGNSLKVKFKDEIQTALKQIHQIDQDIKVLYAKRKEVNTQLKAATTKKDTGTITTLKAQIADINSQIAAKKNERTGVSSDYNTVSASKRAIWSKVQQGKNNEDTIGIQIISKRVDMLTVEATKLQDWITYRQADIDNNLQTKSDALASILTDKQTLIKKHKELLGLEAQVEISLRATLASL